MMPSAFCAEASLTNWRSGALAASPSSGPWLSSWHCQKVKNKELSLSILLFFRTVHVTAKNILLAVSEIGSLLYYCKCSLGTTVKNFYGEHLSFYFSPHHLLLVRGLLVLQADPGDRRLILFHRERSTWFWIQARLHKDDRGVIQLIICHEMIGKKSTKSRFKLNWYCRDWN